MQSYTGQLPSFGHQFSPRFERRASNPVTRSLDPYGRKCRSSCHRLHIQSGKRLMSETGNTCYMFLPRLAAVSDGAESDNSEQRF